MSLEVVKVIAQKGLRVFSREDLIEIGSSLGFKPSYIKKLNTILVEQKSIEYLGKGLYSLPEELLSGGPIHSFEIAIKIAKKGAISHRSALFYYQLTDQIFSTVYVTVPRIKGANVHGSTELKLRGVTYRLIRIVPHMYWGVKQVFLEEARIEITDLERTLIDGLARPELCGGFREVLYAFELAISGIRPGVILDYAKRTSLVVCKRLGWIFDELGAYPEIQEQLEVIPMSYRQKLDATGRWRGKICKRWNIQENIYYEPERKTKKKTQRN